MAVLASKRSQNIAASGLVVLLAGIITGLEVFWPQYVRLPIMAPGVTVRDESSPEQTVATAESTQATNETQVNKKETAPGVTSSLPKKATTLQPVRVRTQPSTSSAIITELEAGKSVELTEDATLEWQGVKVNNKSGYIFKEYLSPPQD